MIQSLILLIVDERQKQTHVPDSARQRSMSFSLLGLRNQSDSLLVICLHGALDHKTGICGGETAVDSNVLLE